jgi:hypothetical protein
MGELIEFYKPAPKAALTLASVVEAPAVPPAKDILETLLKHVDTIDDLVVLTSDKDGVMGFLGTLDGAAETLLFIELIKAKLLAKLADDGVVQ